MAFMSGANVCVKNEQSLKYRHEDLCDTIFIYWDAICSGGKENKCNSLLSGDLGDTQWQAKDWYPPGETETRDYFEWW